MVQPRFTCPKIDNFLISLTKIYLPEYLYFSYFSNQDLLAQKLIFFLFLEEYIYFGAH